MPLYWTIDSKERLVTGGGEGEVTLADAMSLLAAVAGARALSYRKLFDGRAVRSTMTIEELLAVCAKIRSYHNQARVSALAMVMTPEQTETFGRLLEARDWLGRQNTYSPLQPSRLVGVAKGLMGSVRPWRSSQLMRTN
jgi:hypothetical protein